MQLAIVNRVSISLLYNGSNPLCQVPRKTPELEPLFDLAGKTGKNGPRTDLDERVSALTTQMLDRLHPPHAAVDLFDQVRSDRIIRIGLSTAVGDAGDCGGRRWLRRRGDS